jgi:RHS repeat-associated protein
MKRRATYYTAIPNISVPLHQVQNLTDEEIQTLTTTDYCGNVIYENGNLKMILTEEGFITMENGAPVYHYYTKDHQGNNRMVVKAGNNMDGAAEQYNHYYPFGGVFETNNNNNNNNNSSGSNQPYKYNGKEFDRMYGLDWYDYSARIMDPTLGRFNSIDPLAEKYPNISPYVYCLNNPVRYIDPDGKKVYFAKGVSNQFKKDFATSVQHLNSHKQGGMLKQLHKSDNVYYIAEGGEGGNSNFNSSTKTITWSSRTGLLTNNGTELSPTTILNHEVDHALQHDTDPKQQKIDGATKSEQYGNKEEERVITGSEQKTAQGLGEIKEGEVTRTDHGGTLHETTGPTKTDWKDEVIIKPDEKR